MIKISQILGVQSQNNLQIRTSVILRQEFVNNFATLTHALVNAPVPSPSPRKIYCDIMKSIVLNTCITVDLTADRCIACRLLALALMHLPSTVT